MNTKVQLAFAWCGPALIVIFVLAFWLLAGFIPAPNPAAGAEEIKALYMNNLNGIRIGMVASIFGWTLIGPWGAIITTYTRIPGNGGKALTYLQLGSLGGSIAIVVLDLMVFALAAFRPDELPASTTLMLNDFAWFIFLFTVPPFSVWMVAIGLSILLDDRALPAYPRWAGYQNLWTALLITPAALIVFFKTGPFAYNGLLALYVPLAAFGLWIITMTALTVRAIQRADQKAVEHGGQTQVHMAA